VTFPASTSKAMSRVNTSRGILIRFNAKPAAGGLLNSTQNRNHQLHRGSHQNDADSSTDSNLASCRSKPFDEAHEGLVLKAFFKAAHSIIERAELPAGTRVRPGFSRVVLQGDGTVGP